MELHLYDFDGTLFGSPGPPAGYTSNVDEWFRDPVSLSPPCVPHVPGPEWWHPDILPLAIASIDDTEVYTVLMTGRLATVPGLQRRIRELLLQAGLRFDEVHLKPGTTDTGMATSDFKRDELARILDGSYHIQAVHIWDDRVQHLPEIATAPERLGIPTIQHPVDRHALTAGSRPDDVTAAADEVALQKWSQRILMGQEGF